MQHFYSVKNNKLTITLLAIIIAVIYFNSLSNEFIWDDLDLIRDNPYIKDLRNIGRIFTMDLFYKDWKPTNFYRPLQTLSYMVDYSFWKLNPFGYHLTNIFLHFLCGALVYFFGSLILNGRFYALIGTLFFIVHPIHTEAVTYISGRADLLATLFFILSLILFIKSNSYLSTKQRYFYMGSILSFIFGLLSKEMTVVLPLVLLLYSLTVQNKKAIIMRSIPFFIIGIIYIYLRLSILNFGSAIVLAEEIPIGLRLLTTVKVILMYIGIILFPFNLHMDRIVIPATSFFEPNIFISAIFISGILFLIIKSYRYSKPIFFSSMWFFITLLPVSNIFPLNAFISEHWLYLPSIGLFLLLALGFKKLVKISSINQIRQSILFLTIFTLFFYSILTIQQNKIWNNPIVFYQYTLKFSPHRPRLHNNLGNAYYEKGLYRETEEEYKKALEINPDFSEAHFNLGNLYYKIGQKEEAIKEYKEALRINPKYADAHFNLGNLFYAIGKVDAAIDKYKETIAIDRNNAAVHHNLGNIYFIKTEYVKAISEFEFALRIEPNNPDLLITLGDIYRKINDFDKAIDIYNKALKTNPKLVNLYLNLGVSYTLKGKFDEAIEIYNIALQLAPDLAIIHSNLGSVYANMGNFKQAEEKWKKALGLDPNYEKAREYLNKLQKLNRQ